MAVFFTALLGFFAFARRSGSLTENRLASTHIARQALEDLRRLNYEELPVGNNKKPLPRQPNARGYYNVVENTTNMTKDITVVVEWVEPWGLKQSVSLTTTHSNSLHQ